MIDISYDTYARREKEEREKRSVCMFKCMYMPSLLVNSFGLMIIFTLSLDEVSPPTDTHNMGGSSQYYIF